MRKPSNKKKGELIRISLESTAPMCRGKSCTKCLKFLSFDKYRKNAESLDNINSSCIECVKVKTTKYYADNSEKVKKRINEYRIKNRETVNAKKRKREKIWRLENPEKASAARRRYNTKHKDKKNFYTASRRANKKKASPKWISDFDITYIKNIYKQSKVLEELCKTKFNVDHIIPINSDLVCGLHVPWNLQILTETENFKKSNNFDGTNDNETWKEGIK